jgi:hypothetical protein
VSSVHAKQVGAPELLVAHTGVAALQPLSIVAPVAESSHVVHALAPAEVTHAGAAALQPRSVAPTVVSAQG